MFHFKGKFFLSYLPGHLGSEKRPRQSPDFVPKAILRYVDVYSPTMSFGAWASGFSENFLYGRR